MPTTPKVARCQASLGSSSATETLKWARSPSFTLRTTCRLSLSECAPSMRISSERYAIISRPIAHRPGYRGSSPERIQFRDVVDLMVLLGPTAPIHQPLATNHCCYTKASAATLSVTNTSITSPTLISVSYTHLRAHETDS